jgi:hypothetical protein
LPRIVDVEQHPAAEGGIEGRQAERQVATVGDADIDEMADAGLAGGGAGGIEQAGRRIDGEDATAGRDPPSNLGGDDAGAGADIDDDLAGLRRQHRHDSARVP